MYEEYLQFKKAYVAETQISKLIQDFMLSEMMFIFNMHYTSRKYGIRYVKLLNIGKAYDFNTNFSFEVENSNEEYYYKSVKSFKNGYPNIKYSDLFIIIGHYSAQILGYNVNNRGYPDDDCPPYGLQLKCLLYVYQI